MTEYTLEDLRVARQELHTWQERFGDSRSNNPNRYRSQMKEAATKVHVIELALKSAGVIKMTEVEEINAKLDRRYPNARSKTIVTYEDRRYQIRYFPLAKSNSGKTVQEWGHEWRPLK